MNIIAVDDERIALQLLMASIFEAIPDANVQGFGLGVEALAFANRNLCEIAFLDINMSDMNGVLLAKQLKTSNPKINIIFVTAHKQYAMEAFSMHSSGYVMKPATKEKIQHELENLRYPISQLKKHKIWVQCFGNFEVFADGEPVKFKYNKTKELLAFLIDRKGVFCSNAEIIAVLWENAADSTKKKSYLRDLRADLLTTLNALGVADIIRKERGVIAVLPDKIPCDYYQWMQGKVQAINAYRGEYMSQYSWGEFTLGGIEMSGTTTIIESLL